MDEQSGMGDQFRRVSAWPVFVAFGLAIAEFGVLTGIPPVGVGGLLLFVGSIAGILTESEYVESPWPLLTGLSFALLVVGAVLATVFESGIAIRGQIIVAASVILVVGGLLGWVREKNQ